MSPSKEKCSSLWKLAAQKEKKKTVVKPPVWRCLRLPVFLFCFFHSLTSPPTSVLSLLLPLCVDFLPTRLSWSLRPHLFHTLLPPSPISYDSLHLKSIIKLASQCDRSPEESYWEHFPASLSSHRETRLTSQNQDGSNEIRRIPEAYSGLRCCSESVFSFSRPLNFHCRVKTTSERLFMGPTLPHCSGGVPGLITTERVFDVMHEWRPLPLHLLSDPDRPSVNMQRAIRRHLTGHRPFASENQ